MIEAIRAGTAPEIIRQKAAEGTLPVSLAEKIEILVFIAQQDKNEAMRKKAFETLTKWKSEELCALLADEATPWGLLDFLASTVVPGRQDLIEAFLRNPAIPPDLADWIRKAPPVQPGPPPPSPAPAEAAAAEAEQENNQERQTLIQRISAMTPVEKIKAALTGNQEERLALIRDSNRLVARAVLQSPKLSDAEIESFASMKNVMEEVLRLIAQNRAFMKSYSVVRALINNPRAPLDVSMPLVHRMNDRDLKTLSMNRNVPETLRTMAVKFIKQKQEAQKVKISG